MQGRAFSLLVLGVAVLVLGASMPGRSAAEGPPDVLWNDVYDTGGDDQAVGVAVDSSGNIYVTGKTQAADLDFLTVKYDAYGRVLWSRTFDAGGDDAAYGVAVDGSGSVYVAGVSPYPEFRLVKYDGAGNLLWTFSTYGGAINGAHLVVTVDASGSVYLGGGSMNGPWHDFRTIKYDRNGNELWNKTYDTGSDDCLIAIAVDASGSVYVTGLTNYAFSWNYLTIKYDAGGNVVWAKTYDSGYDEQACSVGVDSDGNVYVTGGSETGAGGGGTEDIRLIKYDPGGGVSWNVTYDDAGRTDWANDMFVDAGGNICLAGMLMNSAGKSDFRTVMFDSSGKVVWSVSFDGGGEDQAVGIALGPAGEIVVTGRSQDATWNYRTIKYGWVPAGPPTLVWERTYNSPANGEDIAADVAVDANGSIVVAGWEYRSDLSEMWNVLIRKYDAFGSLIWSRTYDSPTHKRDEAFGVGVDPAGNVVVGITEDRADLDAGGGSHRLVRKYDSGGSLLWSRTMGSGHLNALAVDADGNIATGGDADVDPPGNLDWILCKYGAGGELLWSRTYDHGWWEAVSGVTADSSGNVAAVGMDVFDWPVTISKWLAWKYDSAGNDTWSTAYNGSGSGWHCARAVAFDLNGNLVVGGREAVSGEGQNWLVRKYDAAGKVLWGRTHNYVAGIYDGDECVDLAVDRWGNTIAVGYEGGDLGGGLADWLIMIYSPGGDVLWSIRPADLKCEPGRGLFGAAVTSDGFVVVGGSEVAGQGLNWHIQKYTYDGTPAGSAPPAGAGPPPVQVPARHLLIAPNRLDLGGPQGEVKFHLKGDPGGVAEIRIYDSSGAFMGKMSVTLNAGGVGEATYTAEGIDGKKPAPGAYWALATGGGVNDKKLFFVVKKK